MSERPPPLLKKAEAAAHLGVSIRTLERLVRDRELHPVYIRRHPRFTYDDLNDLAERNRVGGRRAPGPRQVRGLRAVRSAALPRASHRASPPL